MKNERNMAEIATEEGVDLAKALATKVTTSIEGFPASTVEERQAIGSLTIDNIHAWLEEHGK